MKKISFSKTFFFKTKFIYFLDFFRLIQLFSFLRVFIHKLKLGNFSINNIRKIGNYFITYKLILKDALLHRKLNIYEIDTIFLLKNLPLNDYELIFEIGACYGFFTKKIIHNISKSRDSSCPILISVEPSIDRFQSYLIHLQNLNYEKFFPINDFAGVKCSQENSKFISDKIENIRDNKGFLFIDVDVEGFTPYELTYDILKTINLKKFNSILIELGNLTPLSESLQLNKSLLSEYFFIRTSKKRFLFIRK